MRGPQPAVAAALEAASRRTNRLAEGAMALCLAVMTLLVGGDLLGRTLLHHSLFFTDELTRYLLVWTAFLGMSVGVYRGAHPGVDSLVRRLPARLARPAAGLALLLTLLFFAVLIGHGSLLSLRTWSQRSPSLGLPMSLPYLAVPAGGLLMFLHAAAAWVHGPCRDCAEGQHG
jgi:TRAP-type C4-dicarboxylate transport system permease small subunit